MRAKKEQQTRRCPVCGKEFTTSRDKKKYCNDKCKKKALYRRKVSTTNDSAYYRKTISTQNELVKILKEIEVYNKENDMNMTYGKYVAMIKSDDDKQEGQQVTLKEVLAYDKSRNT